MATKTSASYSIMDYTDGLTIISKINSNHPDTLAYDPATGVYNPSWSSTPLSLTPTAYVVGKGDDIIADSTAKNWYYRRSGTTTWTKIVTGTNGFTINASSVLGYSSNNLFDSSHSTVEFKFEYTYHDTTLNLDFSYEVTKTFTRISNGTSVVIARAWSENGEQFKNQSIPSSITLKTELIRGVTSDTTSLAYQWQKYSEGIWSNITGETSTSYEISAASVTGAAQFRCTIKDTDSASDTYNQTFTTNGITILDLTDPYQAVISSSGGAFLKNGTGSTVLTCTVYQNGSEVTSGLSYKWYQNGSSEVIGTAKTLTVSHTMVSVKADFTCEVS